MNNKKIQQIKKDGFFLVFVVLAVSAGILYVAYDNLDESDIHWYSHEEDKMVSGSSPSFQDLFPIILLILIIDILFVVLIYWVTLKRLEKIKN